MIAKNTALTDKVPSYSQTNLLVGLSKYDGNITIIRQKVVKY
jgi:hypothetical protein